MGHPDDPEAPLAKNKWLVLTLCFAPKRKADISPVVSHISNVLRCQLWDSRSEPSGTTAVWLDWKLSFEEVAAVNNHD
jgi:hypothetical protein